MVPLYPTGTAGCYGIAESLGQSNLARYPPEGTAAGGNVNVNILVNQSDRSRQTYQLVLIALFSAILFLLAFTPIGYIDLPLIKATILHVPVILGSILLGPGKGAILGGVFGLTSLIKNTMAPSALSFAFSPFIPVPGLSHGNPWALVICFVPRILVGVVPWFVVQAVNRFLPKRNTGVQVGGMMAAAIVGAFTNTALVMGMIFLVFQDAYAAMKGISVDAVLGAVLSVVAVNGVPEAIVAALIVPALGKPLSRVLRLEPVSAVFGQTT